MSSALVMINSFVDLVVFSVAGKTYLADARSIALINSRIENPIAHLNLNQSTIARILLYNGIRAIDISRLGGDRAFLTLISDLTNLALAL